MKYLINVLAALTVVAVAQSATPDFTELKKASTNFIVMLEALQKDLPQIHDAEGTAKAIDSWTKANDGFTAAVEDFANKYPDAIKGPQPPPEFVATYDALKQLKTKYSSVPTGIRGLAERFRADPKVSSAMERLQFSLARLQELVQRTK
jgi:hypothetical protein